MAPNAENEPDTGPVKPGEVFEGYQIIELLGQGGYASVYHARREFIDRHVAIKISNRSVTREVFRRFQAEARLTHKLKHPNIVEVFDANVASSGHLYIVMELLRGQTFWDARNQYGKFTVSEALLLCAQVADGVEQAHRVGAIHRDLKPLNLFITENNHVKVLDFGIAKLTDGDGSSTQRNLVHGTLKYMSPEQLMGKTLTPRSDIYALGVILFELITGQHPHISEDAQLTENELGWGIIARNAPPINEIDPSVPSYVVDAVAQALSKQPEQRFASMAEFAATLRDCYQRSVLELGQPVTARGLWQAAPDESAVVRSAPPPAQEQVATAVVSVVSPQSLRPTVRVDTPSLRAEPEASAAPPQLGPTPAPVTGGVAIARETTGRQNVAFLSALTLRRVVTVGAVLGFVIGAGITLTRALPPPAPSRTTATGSTPLASTLPQASVAVAQPVSSTPPPVASATPWEPPEAVDAPSSAAQPNESATATPRRPTTATRPKPARPRNGKKAEDMLDWFHQDRRTNELPAKSGL